MRYELRQWTDSTKTEYIVKASSDIIEQLKKLINKPSIPNDVYYRLHIVDTTTNKGI